MLLPVDESEPFLFALNFLVAAEDDDEPKSLRLSVSCFEADVEDDETTGYDAIMELLSLSHQVDELFSVLVNILLLSCPSAPNSVSVTQQQQST